MKKKPPGFFREDSNTSLFFLGSFFPAHLRKSPPSLKELTQIRFKDLLTRLVRSDTYSQLLRAYLVSNVTANLQFDLVESLLCFNDPWSTPCVVEEKPHRCRKHQQCQLLYSR